jgi:hypothetical protein
MGPEIKVIMDVMRLKLSSFRKLSFSVHKFTILLDLFFLVIFLQLKNI